MSTTHDSKFTVEEVKKHNKRKDCWIIIDEHVADVTKFLEKHPAGVDVIMLYAGTDASEIFDRSLHSNKAYELMLTFKIGELVAPPKS